MTLQLPRSTLFPYTTLFRSIASAALLVGGCGGGAKGPVRTTVVAAFYPLAFAARELGGANVDVHDLTPAGSEPHDLEDRKSTRLNSSHVEISYAVFCLKKKK